MNIADQIMRRADRAFAEASGRILIEDLSPMERKAEDDAIEAKARYVRTPAGVRRFKRPIGSIILPRGMGSLDQIRYREPKFKGFDLIEDRKGNLYDIGKDPASGGKYVVLKHNTWDDQLPPQDTLDKALAALNEKLGGGTNSDVEEGEKPAPKVKKPAPKKAPGKESSSDSKPQGDAPASDDNVASSDPRKRSAKFKRAADNMDRALDAVDSAKTEDDYRRALVDLEKSTVEMEDYIKSKGSEEDFARSALPKIERAKAKARSQIKRLEAKRKDQAGEESPAAAKAREMANDIAADVAATDRRIKTHSEKLQGDLDKGGVAGERAALKRHGELITEIEEEGRRAKHLLRQRDLPEEFRKPLQDVVDSVPSRVKSAKDMRDFVNQAKREDQTPKAASKGAQGSPERDAFIESHPKIKDVTDYHKPKLRDMSEKNFEAYVAAVEGGKSPNSIGPIMDRIDAGASWNPITEKWVGQNSTKRPTSPTPTGDTSASDAADAAVRDRVQKMKDADRSKGRTNPYTSSLKPHQKDEVDALTPGEYAAYMNARDDNNGHMAALHRAKNQPRTGYKGAMLDVDNAVRQAKKNLSRFQSPAEQMHELKNRERSLDDANDELSRHRLALPPKLDQMNSEQKARDKEILAKYREIDDARSAINRKRAAVMRKQEQASTSTPTDKPSSSTDRVADDAARTQKNREARESAEQDSRFGNTATFVSANQDLIKKIVSLGRSGKDPYPHISEARARLAEIDKRLSWTDDELGGYHLGKGKAESDERATQFRKTLQSQRTNYQKAVALMEDLKAKRPKPVGDQHQDMGEIERIGREAREARSSSDAQKHTGALGNIITDQRGVTMEMEMLKGQAKNAGHIRNAATAQARIKDLRKGIESLKGLRDDKGSPMTARQRRDADAAIKNAESVQKRLEEKFGKSDSSSGGASEALKSEAGEYRSKARDLSKRIRDALSDTTSQDEAYRDRLRALDAEYTALLPRNRQIQDAHFGSDKATQDELRGVANAAQEMGRERNRLATRLNGVNIALERQQNRRPQAKRTETTPSKPREVSSPAPAQERVKGVDSTVSLAKTQAQKARRARTEKSARDHINTLNSTERDLNRTLERSGDRMPADQRAEVEQALQEIRAARAKAEENIPLNQRTHLRPQDLPALREEAHMYGRRGRPDPDLASAEALHEALPSKSTGRYQEFEMDVDALDQMVTDGTAPSVPEMNRAIRAMEAENRKPDGDDYDEPLKDLKRARDYIKDRLDRERAEFEAANTSLFGDDLSIPEPAPARPQSPAYTERPGDPGDGPFRRGADRLRRAGVEEFTPNQARQVDEMNRDQWEAAQGRVDAGESISDVLGSTATRNRRDPMAPPPVSRDEVRRRLAERRAERERQAEIGRRVNAFLAQERANNPTPSTPEAPRPVAPSQDEIATLKERAERALRPFSSLRLGTATAQDRTELRRVRNALIKQLREYDAAGGGAGRMGIEIQLHQVRRALSGS